MRRLAALGLLVVLATTAGCVSLLGPGEPDRGALSEDASYDWNTSADGTIDIRKNEYTAVYDVSNRTTGDDPEGSDPGTIEVYRHDLLGTEKPLAIRALQFRFPNGTRVRYVEGNRTVVYPNGTHREVDDNASALAVSNTRHRTVVQLPGDEGQLAFTAPKNGKQISTPRFVEGSYVVVLPEDTSVAIPLLARVRPGGYTTSRGPDGRVHVRWDGIRGDRIVVRYYLDRDIQIFGSIVVLLVLLGLGGTVYYLLQIRRLVERRREVGLDVDVEDDSGRDPPPGFG